MLYRVTVSVDDVIQLTELLEHLSGWRKRKVYLNSEQVTWDSVFSFLWCYRRKNSSYRPDVYCFGHDETHYINGVGCIHAHMSLMGYAEWPRYGRWLDRGGTWQFDKERIAHEITKNLYELRFCPAMSRTAAKVFLACIPDQVNPKKNSEWEFVESYSEEPNALPSPNRNEFYESYVVGVQPRGNAFARRVFAALNLGDLPQGGKSSASGPSASFEI